MNKFFITKEGFNKIKTELKNLKIIERPKVIKQIAEARDHGDLKENAEYHAAKDKQGMIEAKIKNFESKISRAEIIDISKLSGDKVLFGAIIELENLDNEKIVTYKIVSEFESDIDNGFISIESPVAMALLGKEKGDSIEITTPGGLIEYEILSVKFK